ncbi:Elongation factor G [Defluviimonas aquaemixtae]|uniref:Elongation factor G n=1 Tax=Albidovulum aquaemixtae TaxID=1542388 RepID=A0A2R8B4Z8_9RHOB|nr:elongation factor G [Defluviimonas aquaemixtae]SPH17706.1 Elongation factor G [Defluviimonas aquaemixtae]
MRCFTVLGPSQSGKTELVGALAALDGEPVRSETAGHLTLNRFSFMGEEWCALDMAGGPEFARMGGAALLAADAAVLCVAPDPDEAVLAAPWLRAVEAANVPCFIFINRMDTPKGRVRDIVAALQNYTGHTIVLRQIPIREGGEVVGAVDLISERAWRYRDGQTSQLVEMPGDAAEREHEARAELLEQMSDYDDALLEELIEDREPATGALFEIARRETQHRDVLPTFLGSASNKNGILRLMKALRHEAPDVSKLRERLGEDKALAVGFHAQIRKHLGKCVMLRALSAGVAQGADLGDGHLGGLVHIGEKGGIDHLEPGEIGISVKSDQLDSGRIFTAGAALEVPDWAKGCPPALARIVTPEHERDEVRLSAALARLGEADPMLRVAQDEGSGHVLLRLQGVMHERQVLSVLAEDFGIEVTTSQPDPRYLETISGSVDEHYRHRKQSGGAGQFADVAITVRPVARGEGFQFAETVKGGSVPKNYIPAVEEGAREALDKGPLGFPVTDLSVTLTDGKHHAVDSSDFAFRTAGRMALREALGKCGPVLLQPIDRVDVHVPSIYSGAMVSLISSLKGQVLGFDGDPNFRGWDIFRALLPASQEEDLVMALGSATQGTAWHETTFDHYEEIYGKEAERISKEHAEAAA